MELSQIYLNTKYMIIYIYICMYICMYLNEIYFLVWTMIWYIWFRTIWLCFTLIPSQWGLFIGTLVPSQWRLFIDTLISKLIGVIHWYSNAQLQRYSVTIVIRLLRIWITFEYLNYFESLKLHIWFWKCLSI